MGLFGKHWAEKQLDQARAERDGAKLELAAMRDRVRGLETELIQARGGAREAHARADVAVDQRKRAECELTHIKQQHVELNRDINTHFGGQVRGFEQVVRHLLARYKERGKDIQDLQRKLEKVSDAPPQDRLTTVVARACAPYTQTHMGSPEQWLSAAMEQIARSHQATIDTLKAEHVERKASADRWDAFTELMAPFMKGVAEATLEDDDDDDCPECNGEGTFWGKTCTECDGSGKV